MKLFYLKRFAVAFVFALLVTSLGGCDSFLSQEPQSILTEDDVFNNPELVEGLLSNYYERLADPFYKNLEGDPIDWAYIDEAMYSGSGGAYQNDRGQYFYGEWALYEGDNGYGLIRDINSLIERLNDTEGAASQLEEADRVRFKAQARFLRAFMYFEMVKRMGGVPIITETHEYEGPNKVAGLQFARNTEKEVYDFVASELEAIQPNLPSSGASKTRANQWIAKAVKARAMLYAASIAKYNDQKTPDVEVPGNANLVGMSNADPTTYYQEALSTAEDIINNGPYSLYEQNPNLRQNFYEAVMNENSNPEVIFVTDYTTSARENAHLFNYWAMPRSARDDNLESAALSPSLDLVESYEDQDGSSGEIQTCQDPSVTGRCVENGSDYVYFDEKATPFEDQDPRLWGTIMYPGSTFRGQSLDFQTGVAVWDPSTNSYSFETGTLGSQYEGGGLMTGLDGPLPFEPNTSNTGFYLRKYIDTGANTGNRGNGSGTWWVRYRYAEILLIASEAALELNQQGKALDYINQVRERAGMPELSSVTLEDIKHERRVELAFEEHRLWDLKRWRDAHEVWNGTTQSDDAVIDAVFLYRVVHPNDAEKDGSYIYVKRRAPRHSNPRFFRLGNYYSAFSTNALSSNPKLVKNPFH